MPGPGTTSLPEWTRSRGKSFDGEEGDLVDRDVNDLGKALVGPFKDLFTIENPKVSIAVNWGLGALAYLIVGSIIAKILRRAGVTSHPDRVG